MTQNLYLDLGVVNGTTGFVTHIGKHVICVLFFREGLPPIELPVPRLKCELSPTHWENTQGITITRLQFPLQLAWATTVHKSQGQTLDKVVYIIDRRPFQHGMLYVAISRVKDITKLLLIATGGQSEDFHVQRQYNEASKGKKKITSFSIDIRMLFNIVEPFLLRAIGLEADAAAVEDELTKRAE